MGLLGGLGEIMCAKACRGAWHTGSQQFISLPPLRLVDLDHPLAAWDSVSPSDGRSLSWMILKGSF